MTALQKERFLGCLVGLAAGDAVGTAVEFSSPGSFRPLTDMTGGGPFGLEPGQWTDDTSMALCLAESLVACGYDPADQMRRFVQWHRHGHLSSTGRCFDIGNATRAALTRFEAAGDPYSGSTDPHSAGNGSVMRLAPIPMAFAADPARAITLCGDHSRTTHAAAECVDACRWFGGLLVAALRGEPKQRLLSPMFDPTGSAWATAPLVARVRSLAAGSWTAEPTGRSAGSGYVIDTLHAAVWAFATTDDFRSGCLRVANLGNDADSTAAVYGQLAGACYGIDGIPATWRDKLAMGAQIHRWAEQLWELAGQHTATSTGK